MNSFSMKASRLFTKKKDSKTNHKDVLIAEEQRSSRTITEAAETEVSAVAERNGKKKESIRSPFFIICVL
jgi:hypothetical protein